MSLDPIDVEARAGDAAPAKDAGPTEDVAGDGPATRRADERRARREAKLEARRKRATARAAARVEKRPVPVVVEQPQPADAPEPEPEPKSVDLVEEAEPETEPLLTVEPASEPDADRAVEPTPEPAPAHESTPEPELEPEPEPEPLSEVLARHGAFDRPRAVPSLPVDEATGEDDSQGGAQGGRRGRASTPSRRRSRTRRDADRVEPEDDGIVEAPRAPKKSLGERLRTARPTSDRADRDPATSAALTDAAAPGKGGAGGTATKARTRRFVVVLAGLVGAAGLVASVVLAFGALLVALDSTDGSLFDTVSSVCDALVGPLADAFTFSGTNAAMKESLVAWGAGAIVYLVVGMVAQSLLRSAVDD